MADRSRKDHPSGKGARPPGQRPAVVISDDEIDAARNNKAARKLLRSALERDQQMERDGLIRP
jgi:hypothetical protein